MAAGACFCRLVRQVGVVTRLFQPGLLLVALLLPGCGLTPGKRYTFAPLPGEAREQKISGAPPAGAAPVALAPAPATGGKPPQVSVSTANVSVGRVVLADPGGRFVVLNFPIGHLPVPGQPFAVYRHGVKVGEVNVTGPNHDDNIAADTLRGDPQVGDEARRE
jgi:hypothetical protein